MIENSPAPAEQNGLIEPYPKESTSIRGAPPERKFPFTGLAADGATTLEPVAKSKLSAHTRDNAYPGPSITSSPRSMTDGDAS